MDVVVRNDYGSLTVIITQQGRIRIPMTLGNNLRMNHHRLSLTTQADRRSAGFRQDGLACHRVVVVAHHNHLVSLHKH